MNTSFYILCLLVLVQFVFSVLIYDVTARRYRRIEKNMDALWHIRMHENCTYNKIIILMKVLINRAERHGYTPDQDIVNRINQEYQQLIDRKDETDEDKSKQK